MIIEINYVGSFFEGSFGIFCNIWWIESFGSNILFILRSWRVIRGELLAESAVLRFLFTLLFKVKGNG